MMKVFYLTVLVIMVTMTGRSIANFDEFNFDNYKNHPCMRPCDNRTAPMKCEYNWTIEWYSVLSKACLDCPYNLTNCLRPQCVSANGVLRTILTVNRMIPGPAVYVCQGDLIQVYVHSLLHFSEGTSIHWHGITQRGSPYMDGISLITQCPILAHSNFEYRFQVHDYGTHMWHAHSGLQRADGLFGPLIVRQYEHQDAHRDKYDFDLYEHVIMLNDWINDTSIDKFSRHHHNDGDNKPSSILINGRGVLARYTDTDGTRRVETPRSEFRVQKGFKYRFRLINGGFLYCPIEFSIDNHRLLIIASDGKLLEPKLVDSLIIYAGERIDFVVEANQDISSYWIKTKGFADCSVFRAQETAVLYYNDYNKQPGELNFNYYNMSRRGLQLNPWNTFINETNRDVFIKIDEMRAVPDNDVVNKIHRLINTTNVKKFYLSMEFNKINNPEFNNDKLYPLESMTAYHRNPLYTPQISGISFMMPSSPILYNWDNIDRSMVCNSSNKDQVCQTTMPFCSCLHTLEFDLNDIVEFVIVDEGFTFQSNHPMHLHGMLYAVIGMGKLNTSIHIEEVKRLDELGLLPRNFDLPPVKDTVTVPVGGYTIVRFVADNPGTWLFHCHLDFHSEIGMALLVRVGKQSDLPAVPMNWPKCGDYYYAERAAVPSITLNSHSQSSFSFNHSIYLIELLLILFFHN